MEPITLIGAGGFVGSGLAEALVLDGVTGVRAVVRAYRSLAGLGRLGSAIDVRLADAENAAALVPALEGSGTVVNLTTGPPAGIVKSTRSIYEACVAARVRRLVHISSAVVYGDVESADITDDSPPVSRHWMPYARARAASEIWLRGQMSRAPLPVTVLRPGIVWGVRSPHTLGVVQALLQKNAYLVGDGGGVFNGIYIDNLIAFVRACAAHPADMTGFFNVADQEHVTWREFYAAFAPACGYDMTRMPTVSSERFPWSGPAVFEYVQALPLVNESYHVLKARLPDRVKARVKAWLAGSRQYDRVARDYVVQPLVARELWHLHRVRHRLPTAKFARAFGVAAPVSFEEAVRRTTEWLTFLGYTTRAADVKAAAAAR